MRQVYISIVSKTNNQPDLLNLKRKKKTQMPISLVMFWWFKSMPESHFQSDIHSKFKTLKFKQKPHLRKIKKKQGKARRDKCVLP